ncbi:MAG: T9SS type A sorting domain-containing protein [Candidatus Hatepunaea meridiana]|nr:T9SS type A sorting domain-containing protein [Candidatus Hatepunaea meridiana]
MGIYLYDAGSLAMHGDNTCPNAIYNNGQNLNQNHNYRGAEIRQRNQANIAISNNNIWDVTKEGEHEGNRNGKLISKDLTSGNVACIAENNWWGDDWHDAEPLDVEDNEVVTQHFYWDDEIAIVVDPKSDDYFPVGPFNEPPEVDDFTDYERGVALQEDGQYRQAVDSFRHYISTHRGNIYKINAMQRMLSCYRSMNGDLHNLKEEFIRMSEEYGNDFQAFGWVADKLSCYCTLHSGDAEAAIEEFRDLLDEAPYPSDSLIIEMNILDIQEMIDNRIDGYSNYEAKICQLTDMLDEIDNRIPTANTDIPTEFDLVGSYPNPFNSTATIAYRLPSSESVTMSIFDVTGRRIVTLIDGRVEAGYHNVVWDGTDVASGIYFCRMKAGGRTMFIKLALIR